LSTLDASQIRALFVALSEELATDDVIGEVYLVGGAVMCLVFEARLSTRDVDAIMRPTRQLRRASARVAAKHGVAEDWLNDAVKGFLSPKAEFEAYLSLPNLRVFVARPEYLLAMKCLSMRLGPEFHDESDVRYLLRYLNITDHATAVEVVTRYYPAERIPNKTLYALEEILGSNPDG
jgi:hypothetical protein